MQFSQFIAQIQDKGWYWPTYHLSCRNHAWLGLAITNTIPFFRRCLTAWKHLEELILCGNRIRSLPSKLSLLPNLRVLRVHSNQLENVPNLTKLSTLKVVDLSHNNLRKINLEDLIVGGHLTYLDISCNERLSLNLENFHNPKYEWTHTNCNVMFSDMIDVWNL